MSPQEPGLWARLLVRVLLVAAAGVMALGFFGVEAAVLVASLTALTYVLVWLRSRYSGKRPPRTDRGGGEGPDPADFR